MNTGVLLSVEAGGEFDIKHEGLKISKKKDSSKITLEINNPVLVKEKENVSVLNNNNKRIKLTNDNKEEIKSIWANMQSLIRDNSRNLEKIGLLEKKVEDLENDISLKRNFKSRNSSPSKKFNFNQTDIDSFGLSPSFNSPGVYSAADTEEEKRKEKEEEENKSIRLGSSPGSAYLNGGQRKQNGLHS